MATTKVTAVDMPLAGVDALILAGGLGTRLRAVLPDHQKVIAPVGNRPFLARLVASLAAVGVERIVLALGHRAQQVMQELDSWIPAGVTVAASIEDMPLGTAGAIRHALPLLHSDTVLVANGDSYVQTDLGAFVERHRRSGGRISMVICSVADSSRYGTVVVDQTSMIREFHEKKPGHCGPGLINAGLYLLERAVVEDIPSTGAVSLEKDVLPAYCDGRLSGFVQDAEFIDIGIPEDYQRAESFFGTVLGEKSLDH